ncbi:MAG: hypothetical protein AABY18_03675 [Candidatus Thermoplasmatota archaeon]|mgnify:CR=1 FL=1
MKHVLLAGLLGLVTVAGCLSDDSAPTPDQTPVGETTDDGLFVASALDARDFAVPALLCQPMLAGSEALHAGAERCNFSMTPDEGREGNEVTIAVNPMDPRNVVGGAKDYYPSDAGECVWDGVYVTHDGGKTLYQDRSFDGSPWRLAAGDIGGFQPNYASQFWCTTDPVAYFDVNGNLYYLLMAYQADPVTGSKTCEDVCPNGALNDWAFNRATQIVAVSDDGGDTFHTFTPVLEGSFPVDFHDKGWIAAGRDGEIHVMWLATPLPGNMYFRSTDGGATFPVQDLEIMAAVGQGSGQGSFIDVGTNDEVYASWTSGGIHLRRSLNDGIDWDADRVVLEPNQANMPGISPRDRRGGFPTFATDRNTFSPFANNLYYVWQDECTDVWEPQGTDANGNPTGCPERDGAAVYFAASTNMGETFTDPIRISTPTPGDETDYEIFPVVSVSPGGVIDVSWMDTQGGQDFACDDVTDCSGYNSTAGGPCQAGDSCVHPGFTQKYVYSLDGGKTWSTEFTVRDAKEAAWNPEWCTHQNGMIFIGDYNDIDSSWQAAHPVWPDSRDGANCKVYTATIRRPIFAEGWPQDDLLNALELIRQRPLV